MWHVSTGECIEVGGRRMKRCAECNEPDYPLDDKTGLCYTCWQIAGMPEGEEE